ncbi:MAG: hypothetical protein QXO42_02610 [Ignisphaera sp.]
MTIVINEDDIALLISTAYSIPSLLDMNVLPVIDRSHVIKMVEMFMDEAIMYVRNLGIEPLSSKYIKEDIYMLCDNLLKYIGEFEGGLIPQADILKHISGCSTIAVLHSHPIPIPVPTLEDLISSSQIGYNVECVISKSSSCLATMVCMEPLKTWRDVISAFYDINDYFLESARYIVVGDHSQIEFLPFPNTDEQNNMIRVFIEVLSRYAKISYARIDLANRIYDVEIFNRV